MGIILLVTSQQELETENKMDIHHPSNYLIFHNPHHL